MDAVTYPNPKVIDFFAKYLVAVRILVSSKPLPQRFKVQWTPTLVLLDEHGEEHHRTVGFLAPEELLPSLLLGIGKSYFDRHNFPMLKHFCSSLLPNIRRVTQRPRQRTTLA